MIGACLGISIWDFVLVILKMGSWGISGIAFIDVVSKGYARNDGRQPKVQDLSAR